jgi:hypothetical protein
MGCAAPLGEALLIDFGKGVSLYPLSSKRKCFMRHVASRLLAGITAAAMLGAVPAAAQSAQNAAADAAIACLDIENVEERLACLETAARELKATRVIIEKENAVASDEAADPKALEESFGAEALDTTKKQKRAEQKKFRLSAKVVEFRINPHDDITAVLENGQVWQQLAGDSETIIIPPGDKLYTVTIKKGPLNNYRLRIDQMGRWIRVRRIK